MYSYSYYDDGSLEEVRNAQGAFVSSYTYHPTGLLNQATYVTSQGTHTATNIWDANGNRVGLMTTAGDARRLATCSRHVTECRASLSFFD